MPASAATTPGGVLTGYAQLPTTGAFLEPDIDGVLALAAPVQGLVYRSIAPTFMRVHDQRDTVRAQIALGGDAAIDDPNWLEGEAFTIDTLEVTL
jgi:hypothetical protein